MEDKVISLIKELDINNLIGNNTIIVECRKKFISIRLSNLVKIVVIKHSKEIEFDISQLKNYIHKGNIDNCINVFLFIKDNMDKLEANLIDLLKESVE